MAWRYRMIRLEDGGILDPDDWNLGWAELAQELNGYLDRDNLGVDWITKDELAATACTTVESVVGSGGTCVNDAPTWKSAFTSGSMVNDTIDVAVDATIEAWASFQLSSTLGLTLWVVKTWYDDANTSNKSLPDDAIRVRLRVGGTVVAESGWVSGFHEETCVMLMGATPVPPGRHEVVTEYMIGEVWFNGYSEQVGQAVAAAFAVGSTTLVTITSKR
jgi:hypothetical protein